MNVRFTNVNPSARTGPNVFASRLMTSLTRMGWDVVDSSFKEKVDVDLTFIESAAQFPARRLVHRLDGIWFKPEQFDTHNKLIRRTYESADHVVWQTEFDRKMVEHHWGKREGSVILNGAALQRVEVVHPSLVDLRKNYDKIFVSSSNWHPQKRLRENIRLFDVLKRIHPRSCLIVLGNSPDVVESRNDIFYLGSVPAEIYLQIYRLSDWMLHLAWLDHCPNVVVEALSQGCPVVCSSSGGTREIVGKNGVIVAEDREYQYELLDYDHPPTLQLDNIVLPEIVVDPQGLDIQRAAEEYDKVLRGNA